MTDTGETPFFVQLIPSGEAPETVPAEPEPAPAEKVAETPPAEPEPAPSEKVAETPPLDPEDDIDEWIKILETR